MGKHTKSAGGSKKKFPLYVNNPRNYSTVLNIDNNKTCDTEDWSNALITGINYILKYIQIERILNKDIFPNITAFALFSIKQIPAWWAEDN